MLALRQWWHLGLPFYFFSGCLADVHELRGYRVKRNRGFAARGEPAGASQLVVWANLEHHGLHRSGAQAHRIDRAMVAAHVNLTAPGHEMIGVLFEWSHAHVRIGL